METKEEEKPKQKKKRKVTGEMNCSRYIGKKNRLQINHCPFKRFEMCFMTNSADL